MPGTLTDLMFVLLTAFAGMAGGWWLCRALRPGPRRGEEDAQLVEARAAETRTDALTGLSSRRALHDAMACCCAELDRSRRPFSVILGDLDQFKKVNDLHGRPTGDEVLRGVAQALRDAVKETGLVARRGGGQFAAVLPAVPLAEAIWIADQMRQAVQATPFRASAEEFHVTMSFGVAEAAAGEQVESLIRRADAALYASKEAGRNRGSWHDGRVIHRIAVAAQHAAPAERPAAPPGAPATDAGAFQGDRSDPAKLMCCREDFRVGLGRRLAEWRRGGSPPTVLLLRVDGYASLVARHGQHAGALVLRNMTRFVSAAIREMDVAGVHDESTLAMLMPGAGPPDILRIAERLREAIARCVLPAGGVPLRFTISAGATATIQGDDVPAMLARAEAALQAAAAAGGNSSMFHDGRQCQPAGPLAEPLLAALQRPEAASAAISSDPSARR